MDFIIDSMEPRDSMVPPLQHLPPDARAADARLFDQRPATLWENTSRGGQRGHFWFAGDNPATIENTSSIPRAGFRNTAFVTYYIGKKPTAPVRLQIADRSRSVTHDVEFESAVGIHRYRWNLLFDPEPLTEAQKQHVDALFRRLLQQFP